MDILNNDRMTLKDISSVAIGWVAGLCKIIVVGNVAGAILLAFATGASAWMGQTVCKNTYNYFKPKVIKFFKRKSKKNERR